MSDQLTCPMCGRNLAYTVTGQPGREDDHTVYSHATLIEYRGIYDGGLFYADAQEGGCYKAWHRWPEGHYLRERAQPYLDDWNRRVGEREKWNDELSGD